MTGIGVGIGLGLGSTLARGVRLLASSTPLTTAALTCTRAQARGSLFAASSDAAIDTPDTHTLSSLKLAAAMAGATNLIDPDISAWTAGGSGTITVLDQGNDQYRLTFNGDGPVVLQSFFASGSSDRRGRCEMRLISGSFPGGDSNDYLGFRDGGGVVRGTQVGLASITSDWAAALPAVTSADATNQLSFRANNSVTAVIEVRRIRAVANATAAAAPAIGSAKGATYAEDVLSAGTPTWNNYSAISGELIAYDWASAAHPVAANATLFAATGLVLEIGAAAPVLTTGAGITSTKTVVANTLTPFYLDWDGVNQRLRIDDETIQSLATTTVPSGALTVGNVSGGGRAAHVVLTLRLHAAKLAAADIDALFAAVSDMWSPLTLR